MKKYIFMSIFLLVISNSSFAEIRNEKAVGLLLGDPIAFSLNIPVKEKTFLNIHAGIWTWSFWHDIDYDTPFLSVDYVWLFKFKQLPFNFYAGPGIAFFFSDNPKDDNDYDAAVAVRLPLGVDFHIKDNFSLGFELAPIYQFAPAYNAKPYIIELNGGLMVRHYF